MKNLFRIFTICLLIVSCSSEEKQSVNTGSELNGLVLANKKVVSQEITLEEISSYYGDEQKEIFRALTPENRKRLWEEKFDKLLISTENEDEKLLLNKMYDELKKIDFIESLEDDNKEITELYVLVAEGVSEFEWNDVYIAITFSSFEFYQGDSASYNVFTMAPADPDEGGGSGGSGKQKCTCRWDTQIAKCNVKNCEETTMGCGWFLAQSCIRRFNIGL